MRVNKKQEENKMKKTMKKILCSLLVVVMCFTSAPLQGFVDFDWSWFDFSVRVSAINELAATGQCGDDVYWNYDSTTGKGKYRLYKYQEMSYFISPIGLLF